MHPTFREMLLRDNQRNLQLNVRNAYLRRERRPVSAPPAESVMLRLSSVDDDDALDELAQLESRPSPNGQHVVAEIGGAIVAALPLGPGSPLADPFRPTAHLMPLLELRAKQLTDDRPRRRSLAVWRTGGGSATTAKRRGRTKVPTTRSSIAAQHESSSTYPGGWS